MIRFYFSDPDVYHLVRHNFWRDNKLYLKTLHGKATDFHRFYVDSDLITVYFLKLISADGRLVRWNP